MASPEQAPGEFPASPDRVLAEFRANSAHFRPGSGRVPTAVLAPDCFPASSAEVPSEIRRSSARARTSSDRVLRVSWARSGGVACRFRARTNYAGVPVDFRLRIPRRSVVLVLLLVFRSSSVQSSERCPSAFRPSSERVPVRSRASSKMAPVAFRSSPSRVLRELRAVAGRSRSRSSSAIAPNGFRAGSARGPREFRPSFGRVPQDPPQFRASLEGALSRAPPPALPPRASPSPRRLTLRGPCPAACGIHGRACGPASSPSRQGRMCRRPTPSRPGRTCPLAKCPALPAAGSGAPPRRAGAAGVPKTLTSRQALAMAKPPCLASSAAAGAGAPLPRLSSRPRSWAPTRAGSCASARPPPPVAALARWRRWPPLPAGGAMGAPAWCLLGPGGGGWDGGGPWEAIRRCP